MTHGNAAQQQARTALLALAAPARPPSKIEQFRSLLPDIEQRIAAGVRHADIIAALAGAGLTMTESEFRNALCRERKRQKGKTRETSQTQAPAAPAPAAAPSQPITARKPGDHRQSRGRQPNW